MERGFLPRDNNITISNTSLYPISLYPISTVYEYCTVAKHNLLETMDNK